MLTFFIFVTLKSNWISSSMIEIFLPFGIQSTQMHINEWNESNFKDFSLFVSKNCKKIVDLEYVIEITNPNKIQNCLNYLVEKSLKTLRFFR